MSAEDWRPRYTEVPAPKRRRRWPWVLGGLIALVVLIAACAAGATGARPAPVVAPGYTSSSTWTPTPAPAPTPVRTGPATTVSSGTYEVGVDMVPGRYKTAGPDRGDAFPHCYWARTRDDSGQLGSIIANQNLQGPGTVTVKAGEFLELSGSCTWTVQ